MSYVIELVIDTSHLLVAVNSAANFFIYCLMRKNFRAATWRLIRCQPAPQVDGPHRKATMTTRYRESHFGWPLDKERETIRY